MVGKVDKVVIVIVKGRGAVRMKLGFWRSLM